MTTVYSMRERGLMATKMNTQWNNTIVFVAVSLPGKVRAKMQLRLGKQCPGMHTKLTRSMIMTRLMYGVWSGQI